MQSQSEYPNPELQDLFHAICSLTNEEEAARFFRDLLTIAELQEFASRWHIVKLLYEGLPYSAIAKQLNTSTTTVTRVAHWLRNGMGGYKAVADRMFMKK